MQEQFVPIDIHTNKLSDWLISRRHCSREWQTQILTIREKINNAIQDMPVHEGITKLLSGIYINYFHCLKIIEILKETEANSKNIFGSYGSQRMKDWQEIVRLYEKENVYLAEAAQMLIRNVNYEVPSLKKQIAKCEQLQVECDKKEAEYLKASNVVRGEFQTLCKQLGIQGQKIKRELVSLIAELPDIYSKLADSVKTLAQAVEFYTEFVKFIFGKEHPGGCVALLKYMIEHGNVTTYEWKYGEPPLKIEEPPLNIRFEYETDNAHADDNAIDFGDGSESVIDFGSLDSDNTAGFQSSGVTIEEGEIDWGISTVGNEIDFNISLEESGIVVECSGTEGGIARDVEALTLLDNQTTRNLFIDDLSELESFLKVRLCEMQGPSNLLTLSQLQAGPPVLQLQTTQSISAMLNQVQAVISEITDSRSQHLYNIKNSPRYVDHLADRLQQKLDVADKMVASQKAVRQRSIEAGEEAKSLEPKLKMIIAKTKELQGEIERDISRRYRNRPVNIMGGVNVL
ncbi:CDK5 regulatory subunit-associated protein 3 [Cryptotermes secundus]|uniref:CDK5 regulatory subunit-associated protein 3 n=1 Tax=Cryptotermes secundus TaxID=105785 RepID=A0A2J7PWZ1_9NEOP|nr:CDK5 regulatory subunit-associated protein 3 isoform X2 [Cryptotermes secundus]PNF20855.1 CDK5 regulatory subunit-associated protein 3 [Cryptotermes secundus]